MQTAEWLETTAVGLMVRESAYGFPIIVGIHLVALAWSVGLFLWFDLRLLGLVLTGRPASRVYRRIMPWTMVGFAAMVVSGAMLFVGYATDAVGNTAFRLKLLALVVAGLNAACYHLVTERQVADWPETGPLPLSARAAGLVSILAWATVICAGRAMSYTMF